MPDPKTQRYVGLLAVLGLLASCFGCTLAFNNQMTPAVVAFVVAEFVLIPAFVFMLRIRRRTKRVVQQQTVQKEQELEALAGVQDLLSSDKRLHGRETES